MKDILKIVGWIIIGLGVLAGIIIMFTLTIEVPYGIISETHTEPHPLRFIIGFALIASSIISGIIILGFAEVIEHLLEIRSALKSFINCSQIKQESQNDSQTSHVQSAPIIISGWQFVKLLNASGSALCLGCERVDTKRGMFYCKEINQYYHEQCLPKPNSENSPLGSGVFIDGGRYVKIEEDGEAFCHGCRQNDIMKGMYYCKELELYYHEKCMPKPKQSI